MASIDVGIHPDPARIQAHHFGADSLTGGFSTLTLATDGGGVSIYVHNRSTLDALQAALDEIRAEMGKAEQAAMHAAAQTASDQVPTEMADWPAMAAMAPGELMEIHGK